MDSAGTATYKRDGAGVTAPILSDSSAVYTPGISERRSSTTKFYGTDQLGTNTLETNSSQTVTSTKTYDAFGMLQASTGSSASPFGFAGAHGYQEDGDSGLKPLGHRYEDGDPYRDYDQQGDTSGSLTAKRALQNWVKKNEEMARLFASIVGILGLFACYVGLTTVIKRLPPIGGMRALSHPGIGISMLRRGGSLREIR